MKTLINTFFKKNSFTKNQKGLAVLEALPVILVMFVLMGATLGTWGIVHTAILNSIAARNYIFYTFNNGSDLSYYGQVHFYRDKGYRFSYISSKHKKTAKINMPALRFVDFRNPSSTRKDLRLKKEKITSDHWQDQHLPNRTTDVGTDPAWIMVGYGICLNAQCEAP